MLAIRLEPVATAQRQKQFALPRVRQPVAVLDLWLAPTELAQPRPNSLGRSARRFPLPIHLRACMQSFDLPKLLQQRSFQGQSHPHYTARPLGRVILVKRGRLPSSYAL